MFTFAEVNIPMNCNQILVEQAVNQSQETSNSENFVLKLKSIKMFKILCILALFVIQIECRKISYKSLRNRIIKQKTLDIGVKGLKHVTKAMKESRNSYFTSVIDDVTDELNCAGYILFDKAFEGILELITILEVDEELSQLVFEKAREFIHTMLVGLFISVVLTIREIIGYAIVLWRFYVKTIQFMENTVKRVKEVKRVTAVLVKKLDAIRSEEKEELIQPMYSDLYAKTTKI